MNLGEAHLSQPSDADLLRGAADALRMAMGQLKAVSAEGLDHRERLALFANLQMAEMQCDEGAANWGKRQAAAIGKVMPL